MANYIGKQRHKRSKLYVFSPNTMTTNKRKILFPPLPSNGHRRVVVKVQNERGTNAVMVFHNGASDQSTLFNELLCHSVIAVIHIRFYCEKIKSVLYE